VAFDTVVATAVACIAWAVVFRFARLGTAVDRRHDRGRDWWWSAWAAAGAVTFQYLGVCGRVGPTAAVRDAGKPRFGDEYFLRDPGAVAASTVDYYRMGLVAPSDVQNVSNEGIIVLHGQAVGAAGVPLVKFVCGSDVQQDRAPIAVGIALAVRSGLFYIL
jgi:hypothetical protein